MVGKTTLRRESGQGLSRKKTKESLAPVVEEEDDDEVRERASASASRVVEWRVIVCGGVWTWTSGMQGKMAALRPDKRG